MDKLKLNEVVIVEGRYDAVAIASVVDALIITTDGFSIFTSQEKKELIRRLGKVRGLLILTDSDAAGFRIRNYIEKIAAGCTIRHAYIPALIGKESRKSAPSKEGTVGVEGMPKHLLINALHTAGIQPSAPPKGTSVSYTDLFEWGLSGTADSAERRRSALVKLGLPPRLSKRAMLEVLSCLYTRQELLLQLSAERPILFWDFHGTLTMPDVSWFDAAIEAAAQAVPHQPLNIDVLKQHFSKTCLPWFTIKHGDTRHLAQPGEWWAYCEGEFEQMLQKCGYSQQNAKKIAPLIRPNVLRSHHYRLYPDAVSTLTELQRRGYKQYILSNNFPELEELVQALGIRDFFEEVLVSANIGYDKPHPEIFGTALRAAGMPPYAWMIGDNPIDDIEGSAKCGFVAVLAHGAPAHAAHHHIQNLADILPLLP